MKQSFFIIAAIALGGAGGALARYLISGLIHNNTNTSFPWGTLVVNLVGAFVLGFVWNIFQETVVSTNFKLFLTVGVLGGFTTFSTYTLETLNLLRDGEYMLASVNVLASNILGLFLVWLGFITSQFLFGLFR